MLPEMTRKDIELVIKAEETMLSMEQSPVHTDHIIHGGIYYRTMFLAKGQSIVGAFIKVDTTLIFCGSVKVYIGNIVEEINGYRIITAKKNRKQLMYALDDTYVTMCFKTNAKTVEEAEEEFTDEAHKLVSRTELGTNTIRITKE